MHVLYPVLGGRSGRPVRNERWVNMQAGRVSRGGWMRSLASAGALGVLALVTGCTDGGDGVDVVADDPAGSLAAAAAATPDSGRFALEVSMDLPFIEDADAPESSIASSVVGEFSGTESSATVTEGSFGQDWVIETVTRGQASYARLADVLSFSPYRSAGDGDPEFSGTVLGPDAAAIEELAAGREWIELTSESDVADDGEEFDAGLYAAVLGMAPVGDLTDPSRLLADIADVRELEPTVEGGERFRTFSAVLTESELWGTGFAFEVGHESSADDAARIERIESYERDHTGANATVLVDDHGFVRSVHIELWSEIEDAYRHCLRLTATTGSVSLEFSDLGADIEISVPDPESIVTAAELQELPLPIIEPDIESLEPTEEDRVWLEAEVIDSAWAIDLDVSAVPSMSLDELEAALDRIEVARESMPLVETAMGEMDRVELLRTIRIGVEMLELEPIDFSHMSDAELANIIDTYLEANGGPVGVGTVGEGEEFDSYQFEDCPA